MLITFHLLRRIFRIENKQQANNQKGNKKKEKKKGLSIHFNSNFSLKYSKTPIYRASWGKGIRPGKLISTVNWG